MGIDVAIGKSNTSCWSVRDTLKSAFLLLGSALELEGKEFYYFDNGSSLDLLTGEGSLQQKQKQGSTPPAHNLLTSKEQHYRLEKK